MAKAMRIRTDDTVLIKSGKDKGKSGRVIRVEPSRRRVYVEGLNIIKRHQRPRSMDSTKAGAPAASSRRRVRSTSPTWRCWTRPTTSRRRSA